MVHISVWSNFCLLLWRHPMSLFLHPTVATYIVPFLSKWAFEQDNLFRAFVPAILSTWDVSLQCRSTPGYLFTHCRVISTEVPPVRALFKVAPPSIPDHWPLYYTASVVIGWLTVCPPLLRYKLLRSGTSSQRPWYPLAPLIVQTHCRHAVQICWMNEHMRYRICMVGPELSSPLLTAILIWGSWEKWCESTK